MAKKDKGTITGEPVTYQIPAPAGGVQMETFIPWTLVKRGVRRQVITPIYAPEAFVVEAELEKRENKARQDTPLLRALGLAHYWQRLIDDGKFRTVTEIAESEKVNVTQVRRVMRLALFAPEVVERLATLPGVVLENVIRRPWPYAWNDQIQLLEAAASSV